MDDPQPSTCDKMNMGHIYVLTSPSGKQYVGQTVCYLSNGRKFGYTERWKSHIRESKSNRSTSRILNNAICKYGSESFKVELIEEISVNELDNKEIYWIEKLNTISPYGYNLSYGGKSRHKLSDESKKILSEKTTGKIKRKTNDLPIYVYECEGGYRISGHPILPSKRFTSFSKEKNLELILDYLKNSKDIKNQREKLPQYIYRRNDGEYHGYIVKNHPNLINKSFTSKTKSLDEMMELALKYINSNK